MYGTKSTLYCQQSALLRNNSELLSKQTHPGQDGLERL